MSNLGQSIDVNAGGMIDQPVEGNMASVNLQVKNLATN